MITCQHAQLLFDRYLDGELSGSLQTELHAHRLNCSACQNELALLEACGDVIALDRREPRVGTSFTDRVLLAQRGRRIPRRRHWSRTLWLAGSPMAAAASLAFTLFVIMPAGRTTPVTAAKTEAAPAVIQQKLLEGRSLPPEVERELEQTPQMEAGSFVDALLVPIVERSKTTLEGTRRSAEELELLMRIGLSNTNEVLVARWRDMEKQKKAETAALRERTISDSNPFDPAGWGQPPVLPESMREPSPDSNWTDRTEPL